MYITISPGSSVVEAVVVVELAIFVVDATLGDALTVFAPTTGSNFEHLQCKVSVPELVSTDVTLQCSSDHALV